jgi:cation diffusion facilitator family transporter
MNISLLERFFMKRSVRITIIGIAANVILFFMKLTGGIFSGSLALLSDSFNSLTDILASLAIFFAVRIGTKKADLDHPFGHQRAEPIAGLIVAIFAAILGFEVMKNAFEGFFETREPNITWLIFGIVIFSIVVKFYTYFLFRSEGKKSKSPALLASSIDYRNDILVSVSVLLGTFFVYIGFPIFDSIVALCIGIFIVYSGFKIGLGNLDFLMGKVPGKQILDRLKGIALSIEGVKSLNDVRAHYLGNFIQIEIHIEVDKKLDTEKSHQIAKNVQNMLQEQEIVDYAFVHVDPV